MSAKARRPRQKESEKKNKKGIRGCSKCAQMLGGLTGRLRKKKEKIMIKKEYVGEVG